MKVSVIIPVYNVEKYLRACLDSVVNQTLKDLEIICVDDGSTDGSPAILAEYAAKDPRLTVIAQANASAGAARNRGLDVATGEYLFFFDPDDYAATTMLEKLVARADATNADIVLAGRRTLDDATGKISEFIWPLPRFTALGETFPPEAAKTLVTDVGTAPWNKLFRRSFVVDTKIRFQEVRRANDVAFVCTALYAASRLAVASVSEYVFRRGRAGSLQSQKDKDLTAFAVAFRQLRVELEARGLIEKFGRQYRNLVLAHCFYNLLGYPVAEAFLALYGELHGHLLAELGLAGRPKEDFDNPTHYRYLQLTETNAEPWPLVMQLLRERHTTWAAGEELKRQLAQEKKKSETAAGKQAAAEKSLLEAKAALTTSESALAATKMMLETTERDLAMSREAQAAAKTRAERAESEAAALRPEAELARFTAHELAAAQSRAGGLPDGSHHGEMSAEDRAFLQARMLKLMKAVRDLCDRHGLRYFMIAGTLLGAARHQGFIPWDDDVDLAMPREDFEKFLSHVAELPPDVFCQAPDTGDYPLFIATVRENGTFVDELLRKFDVHHGIGIDVFPLDACPTDDGKAARAFKLVEAATSALLKKGDPSLVLGPKGGLKRLIFDFLCTRSVRSLRKMRRNARLKAVRQADGSRLCTFTGRHRYPAEAYPAEWFASSVELPFAGETFSAPVGWRALLRHMYDDWETPRKEDVGEPGSGQERPNREREFH